MAAYLEGPKVIDLSHLAQDKPRLIREARALSARKGHFLGEFTIGRIVTGYPPSASRAALTATCRKCGRELVIDPQHGAIFGSAVEKDCLGI
ncbi:MAG: hypothetical protein JRI59_06035 [Deltaproteobacteria bacterium]|nr:hypothetical protein [Deltaproteobacteria bacterium]